MNEDRDWTIAEVPALPQCDFCEKNAAFDGATALGPWAFMCRTHWKMHGRGKLGLGHGQQLKLVQN